MTARKEVIGLATLWLGDCREIAPTLERPAALITDPPYGINIAANPVRQKHAKAAWDALPPSAEMFDILLPLADLHVIWGGNYFPLPQSPCFYVWDKCQPQNFSLAMCEQAWVSRKGPAKLFRKSVLSYAKEHPTQKPVELMAWCIEMLGVPEGGAILDPYMGSGTTGVAAVQAGHPFLGIEMDPGHFDTACRRLDAAMGSFVRSGQPGLFDSPALTNPYPAHEGWPA